MELYDGDAVILRDGSRGIVAGDIIGLVLGSAKDAYDYALLENYLDDGRHLMEESLDIMSIYRINWGDDDYEFSREYELIWERVDPYYMLKDGDTVILRNGKECVVSGPYFVYKDTYEVICWDDFTHDLQHQGNNCDVDVMVITRENEEIWRRN